MKRTLFIKLGVFIISIVVILGGIVLLNKNKEEWPKDDIYFFDSNGYLAFEEGETIYVKLLMCSLHRNGKNPINNYDSFYLLTDNGMRYRVNFDDSLKDTLCREDAIISLSTLELNLDGSFSKGETIKFESMILKSGDKETVRKFGEITVEIIEAYGDNQIELTAESLLKGELNSFNMSITNNTKDSFIIDDAYLGKITDYSLENTKILDGDSEKVDIIINGMGDFSKDANYYVLKPKISLKVNEGIINKAVLSPIVYISNVDEKYIRQFLLESVRE